MWGEGEFGKEKNNFKDKQVTSRFLISISGWKAQPFIEIGMAEEEQVGGSEFHFKDTAYFVLLGFILLSFTDNAFFFFFLQIVATLN